MAGALLERARRGAQWFQPPRGARYALISTVNSLPSLSRSTTPLFEVMKPALESVTTSSISTGAPFGVSHLSVLRRAPGSRTPCFLVPNQARSPCRRTRCARVWQSAHSRLTTLRPSSPGLLQCPRRLRPAAAVTVDFRLHLTCSGVVNAVPSPCPLAGTKPGCGESNPDLRFWRPPCFRNTSPEFRTKSGPAVPFSALQLAYQDLRDQSNRFSWVPRGLFGPCLAVLLC